MKARQLVVLRGVGDLDRIAADFAIFDVRLASDGKVEDHRYLFAAVRAHERTFIGMRYALQFVMDGTDHQSHGRSDQDEPARVQVQSQQRHQDTIARAIVAASTSDVRPSCQVTSAISASDPTFTPLRKAPAILDLRIRPTSGPLAATGRGDQPVHFGRVLLSQGHGGGANCAVAARSISALISPPMRTARPVT